VLLLSLHPGIQISVNESPQRARGFWFRIQIEPKIFCMRQFHLHPKTVLWPRTHSIDRTPSTTSQTRYWTRGDFIVLIKKSTARVYFWQSQFQQTSSEEHLHLGPLAHWQALAKDDGFEKQSDHHPVTIWDEGQIIYYNYNYKIITHNQKR
jgi:hypothetical protein